jgi:septum formation protein
MVSFARAASRALHPLILASTSPYRKALLERLGVPFEVRRPDCDEDAYKAEGMAPLALAERLALEKARSVARLEPQAFVIGSDQVVELREPGLEQDPKHGPNGGRILGKPGSVEAACGQLARLSGTSHALITAVAVCCPDGRVLRHTDLTRMTMRKLTADEIQRYVASDQPLDCAGSYKIEARGIALFEQIECADYNAISGLPLLALAGLLREAGFAVP